MPKYYCDYCDTYLTHDSPSVRKTHCGGRKHKENVCTYYQKWLEDQVQKLVDDTTAAFKAGKIPSNPYVGAPGSGGAMIPPPAGLAPPPYLPQSSSWLTPGRTSGHQNLAPVPMDRQLPDGNWSTSGRVNSCSVAEGPMPPPAGARPGMPPGAPMFMPGPMRPMGPMPGGMGPVMGPMGMMPGMRPMGPMGGPPMGGPMQMQPMMAMRPMVALPSQQNQGQ